GLLAKPVHARQSGGPGRTSLLRLLRGDGDRVGSGCERCNQVVMVVIARELVTVATGFRPGVERVKRPVVAVPGAGDRARRLSPCLVHLRPRRGLVVLRISPVALVAEQVNDPVSAACNHRLAFATGALVVWR